MMNLVLLWGAKWLITLMLFAAALLNLWFLLQVLRAVRSAMRWINQQCQSWFKTVQTSAKE